jgi:hypothetical protein
LFICFLLFSYYRSAARKFPDIDVLVSHAYDTCKVGLRTKHLGFHKALCVLMGWNWNVAPDTSKSHYAIPVEEVNAIKGDLMLWPPVVVIHNSSIAIKAKGTESKFASKEEIEGLLAGQFSSSLKELATCGLSMFCLSLWLCGLNCSYICCFLLNLHKLAA